jgi:hypothetical protein
MILEMEELTTIYHPLLSAGSVANEIQLAVVHLAHQEQASRQAEQGSSIERNPQPESRLK